MVSCLMYCCWIPKSSAGSYEGVRNEIESKESGLRATYKALGVLPDDGHIHIPSLGSLHALDGPHIGVEVHLLPQRDDGTRVSGHLVTGTRDGAEHGGGALILKSLHRSRRESDSSLLEVLESSIEVDKSWSGDSRHILEDTLGGL